jgi:hypothetical protein
MNYVSYVTGEEYYKNYCKPFINSIYSNDLDGNKLFLYVSNISKETILETTEKFGDFVKFLSIPDFFGNEFWSKMAMQSYCFAHFLENISSSEDVNCLIDCDTIILKKIYPHIKNINFDIALTVYEKPHNTPYGDVSLFPNGKNRFNAGVIFTKGKKSLSFFYELAGRLIFYTATRHRHVYPHAELLGPQQSTIGLMLFGKELELSFDNNLKYSGLNFSFLPCSEFNETESIGVVGDKVKILHLKGGWRKLIPLPDWESVKNTPRRKEWSESIYQEWEKYRW